MDIIDPILGIAEKLYSLCGEVKANKKRFQCLDLRIKALEELVRAVKVKGLGEYPAHVENGLSELKFTLESAQDVSLAEGTKERLDTMHEKMDSTKKDVKDIKAMLETSPGDKRGLRVCLFLCGLHLSTFLFDTTSTIVPLTQTILTALCTDDNCVHGMGNNVSFKSDPKTQHSFASCTRQAPSIRTVFYNTLLHQSEKKFKVHGCINSSKFLLDTGYRVKLGGLELAKTETSLKRSKDRKSCSLCYSSPEQLESINHPYNKACEMYSFGIVLWEIATCEIPFRDCLPEEVLKRVSKDKCTEPLPEDCPKQLGELINACRSYDSFHRPTAGVLVDKLHKVVEQLEED
uniref:Protein kinase domain-containing protein n=1 Tax=Hucho hucho TaxID=62062 RepID=A0A4W5N5N0_9TELE